MLAIISTRSHVIGEILVISFHFIIFACHRSRVIDVHMQTAIYYFHSNKRCQTINVNTLNLLQHVISKNKLAKDSILPGKCIKVISHKTGLYSDILGSTPKKMLLQILKQTFIFCLLFFELDSYSVY